MIYPYIAWHGFYNVCFFIVHGIIINGYCFLTRFVAALRHCGALRSSKQGELLVPPTFRLLLSRALLSLLLAMQFGMVLLWVFAWCPQCPCPQCPYHCVLFQPSVV